MILLPKKYGRLGNRLRLAANIFAFGEEHRITVYNPSFLEYATYFDSTAADVWCRYPLQPSATTRDAARDVASYLGRVALASRLFYTITLRHGEVLVIDDVNKPEVQAILEEKVTILNGFAFRCPDLLNKHAATIRKHFRPTEKHANAVERLLAPMRQNGEVLVGVHMRFGDYKTYLNGAYYFDISVYLNAMRRCVDELRGRDVRFLVCTDGTFDLSVFGDLQVTFGNNHVIEDLYGLAGCDYIIGPPSTYSHWASFYAVKPLTFIRDATTPFVLNHVYEPPGPP